MMWSIMTIMTAGIYLVNSESFSGTQCRLHQPWQLRVISSSLAQRVETALVPNRFASVSRGTLTTAIEEDVSNATGGGTNSFGSYGTFTFDGSYILPDDVCTLPKLFGGFVCNKLGLTSGFMLGPADVIAFVGCSPPPMKYFSYDVIIDTRLDQEFPFYPGMNFGDTISNANINASFDRENENSNYDQPVVIIHSADFEAASKVADAYEQHGGFSRSSISIRIISAKTVRLWDRSNGKSWRETKPDILLFIARLAVPVGGAKDSAYTAYKKTVWPVQFFFADDNEPTRVPIVPSLKPRYSSEVFDETTSLQGALDTLVEAVIRNFEEHHRAKYVTAQRLNLTAEGFYDDWDSVLANQSNKSFVAGTRDATYGIPTSSLPIIVKDLDFMLGPNTAVVIVGVLHTKVLGAAYSSVGVDVAEASVKFVETHWYLDADLEGSAVGYLPKGHPAADLLFAVEILPPGRCCSGTASTVGVKQARKDTNDASQVNDDALQGARKGEKEERERNEEGGAATMADSMGVGHGKGDGCCRGRGDFTGGTCWCAEFGQAAIDSRLPVLILGERIYSLRATGVGPAANTTLSSRMLVFRL